MANTYTITITAAGAEAAEDEPRAVASWLLKLAARIRSGELPERVLDVNGNTVGTVDLAVAEEDRSWAGLLTQLPILQAGNTSDLLVEDEDEGVRVWLSRCGLGDGEPFRTTVHVEEYDEDQDVWWEAGYFDGDEPDPQPTGTLGAALEATREALAAHLAEQG